MTAGGQAQIGNVDLVKQLNSAAVYRLIDQHGPISRIQIAEQSQLAPASVTKITRQLIERGLIKEVDQQASTGGRRAISIIAETRNFNAIGVRLGRYDATLTLYDLSSKTTEEEHFPLPERTEETLEHALLNIIATFIENCQRKIRELIAISVILPGLVDPESGVIRYMPHIAVENWGWSGRWRNASTLPALLATISAARRWPSTILAQAVIAKTPFWCACTAVPGRGLSPTGAFLSAATATLAKLAIFRSTRWANAATAATSAVWRPSRPMPPLNSGFATCWSRATRAV